MKTLRDLTCRTEAGQECSAWPPPAAWYHGRDGFARNTEGAVLVDVQPHREDAVCLVIRRNGAQMVNWLYWLGPPRERHAQAAAGRARTNL